jgi:hypothetical protein
MSKALSDITSGRVRKPLGGGNSDAGDNGGASDEIRLNLATGERLVATYDSKRAIPSTYKKPDGTAQDDVTYYSFTVAEDTGLFHMAVNPETGRKAEEPIPVGAKVSVRAKGDLAQSMAEAEPGMLLEIEALGTKTTNGGFNFNLFLVSELVADES